jgi:hypothetical protein
MFANLIARFPTSEALFAWLKSSEGGSLSIRDTRVRPDDDLVLIHYNKESNMTLEHVGYFRSVVWNAVTNQPVCVAPTKSAAAPMETFTVAEDFVDGVMINMFWTPTGWRFATRTKLDALNTFYSRKPFALLFLEAAAAMGLNIMSLNQSYTYSWVLQHPEERIVVAPTYGVPKLFLVEIRNSNMTVTDVPEYEGLRPKRHALATINNVEERVEAWGVRFGAQWKGLMLKDADGQRYGLVTEQYTAALALRGNVAKLPFVWLERFSQKKINQYLALYPEETNSATAVIEAFKACTQEAYDLYQKIYKRREFPLGQAPQKYRKLLWDIHAKRAGSYFPNLVNFMNEQDTARKLWLVNYEVRYAVTNPVDISPADVNEVSDAALNQLADELEGQEAVHQQEAAEEADRLQAFAMSEQPDSVS